MGSMYDKYNCSSPDSHHPDEEYSDISGIGVVVAFLTVAYMVTLLSFLDYYLCFGLVPSPGVHQGGALKLRNEVDRAAIIPFRRALRSLSPSLLQERRVQETHDALHAFVMTISEAQTYTGIAILISGVIVLFSAALSEYHWEMVVLLAWSCHVTNVTAMTSFRSHLFDRPWKRLWMILCMICLVVMLVMAVFPTGFWFAENSACNSLPVRYAICAITPERIQEVGHAIFQMTSSPATERFVSMILPLCIICVTFCTRAFKLSARLSQIPPRMEAICGIASMSFLKRFDDTVSKVNSPVIKHYLVHGIEPLMLALLLSVELHWEFLTSMLSELVFALGSIGWVTRRVDNIRYHRWTPSDGPQNQWTFGQILPIALLIYPSVSLAETILPLFMKTYGAVEAASSASQSHNDTSTNSTDVAERHGPSTTTDCGNKTPIRIYMDQPSSLGQTWPWKSYVTYQYLFQVFLLAFNLFLGISDYPIKLLSETSETFFFLHPFTTYITILLHMQAEFMLKSWFPADWPNRQRQVAMLHFSVSASIAVLFFGINAWVSYQRFWLWWWITGWHFPNFDPKYVYSPPFHDRIVTAFAWVSGYLIAYHVVVLCVSLWANFRTIGDLSAEVALEDQG